MKMMLGLPAPAVPLGEEWSAAACAATPAKQQSVSNSDFNKVFIINLR
jgi:hypothetical protein